VALETAVADWFGADIDATQSPTKVTFFVNSTVLPPGTYTTHPTVAIFKADRTTAIALRTVDVSYQLQPQQPAVIPSSVQMTSQVGYPDFPLATLQIRGNGLWTATVDYASGSGWLRINGSGTFPETGPAPTMLALGATQLPAGTYAATLHIALAGQTFDVPVSLLVP
jgi:hypothetical protein